MADRIASPMPPSVSSRRRPGGGTDRLSAYYRAQSERRAQERHAIALRKEQERLANLPGDQLRQAQKDLERLWRFETAVITERDRVTDRRTRLADQQRQREIREAKERDRLAKEERDIAEATRKERERQSEEDRKRREKEELALDSGTRNDAGEALQEFLARGGADLSDAEGTLEALRGVFAPFQAAVDDAAPGRSADFETWAQEKIDGVMAPVLRQLREDALTEETRVYAEAYSRTQAELTGAFRKLESADETERLLGLKEILIAEAELDELDDALPPDEAAAKALERDKWLNETFLSTHAASLVDAETGLNALEELRGRISNRTDYIVGKSGRRWSEGVLPERVQEILAGAERQAAALYTRVKEESDAVAADLKKKRKVREGVYVRMLQAGAERTMVEGLVREDPLFEDATTRMRSIDGAYEDLLESEQAAAERELEGSELAVQTVENVQYEGRTALTVQDLDGVQDDNDTAFAHGKISRKQWEANNGYLDRRKGVLERREARLTEMQKEQLRVFSLGWKAVEGNAGYIGAGVILDSEQTAELNWLRQNRVEAEKLFFRMGGTQDAMSRVSKLMVAFTMMEPWRVPPLHMPSPGIGARGGHPESRAMLHRVVNIIGETGLAADAPDQLIFSFSPVVSDVAQHTLVFVEQGPRKGQIIEGRSMAVLESSLGLEGARDVWTKQVLPRLALMQALRGVKLLPPTNDPIMAVGGDSG